MPTMLLNVVLGLVPDRSVAVRGPDRVAAVLPMFDEEAGAARALASLLGQREPVDEVVISVNGGRDRTPEAVAAELLRSGYAPVEWDRWGPARVPRTRWSHRAGGPDVTVVIHAAPLSKADSINLAVAAGLVGAERVLVMDGDTVLDPGFVAAMRDGFYRLRRRRERGRTHFVIDDVALQSGAVTSLAPSAPGPAARLVSAARAAEYAFATLLRRGQTARLGRGGVFGASRLYTVVGCGFVARASAFPLPADTLTEDHDFTLQVQDAPAASAVVASAELWRRGFRVRTADGPRPWSELTGGAVVEFRTTADARFEAAASMATEDPPRLGAYLGQVERWVGGGLESLLKRALDRPRWRRMAPNVRYALLAAQLENLVGVLLLLLALPIALGLAWPWLGAESVARWLAAWLLADAAVTGALVFVGAWLQERARAGPRPAAVGVALRRTVLGLGPLLLLRPLNVVAYVSAVTRVLPRFLGRRARDPSPSVTWERPRALPRAARTRGARVGLALVGFALAGFVGSAQVAASVWPVERDAWQRLRAGPPVDLAAHATVPLAGPALTSPAPATLAVARPDPAGAVEAGTAGYCAPGRVGAPAAGLDAGAARAAPAPQRLGAGAPPYQPLSPWGLKLLARLAPLAARLEAAATAYGLPAPLLLQMLLNESDLDPLAVGPTDDLGLAQVTADALVLLASISADPASPFANPGLLAGSFSVFDPEFSVCAGAAKLAWARSRPGGEDDGVAYARYVNPLHGVVRGRVSDRHRPLVDAFEAARPMVDALGAVFAAYRADPAAVTPAERALLGVAQAVADGELGVEGAYRAVAGLVVRFGVHDPGFFDRLLAELYEEPDERVDPVAVVALVR